MNIYITLDYELFFGARSGSVEKCIIEPTEELLKIVNPYNIKFVCFVDAGYLWALEKYKDDFSQLQSDYDKVTHQLKKLHAEGHGIELHIHPHWEDTYYDGENWVFNTERYKLADFSETEVLDIVTRYNGVLKRVSGATPVAYRAGGWSAQPFAPIKKALEANDIFIDSTVYPGGYYRSKNQSFDFRNIKDYTTEFTFSDDLTIQDSKGKFKEIAISAQRVSPFFFWEFALKKMLKQNKHVSFGDGSAVAIDKKELVRLLTRPSHTVVSIDGCKAKLLFKALKKYVRKTKNKGNFVLIGHPKAFTPYSLKKLNKFIAATVKTHKFVIYKG
ncbi:MAG: hypothetical protein V7691_08415 [Galbibacter orientalis]|uniref:hypothetical protein n=1 Tax=Galbibacter orientalis TaxID=453852 RepID=UPI0030029504